MVLVGFSAYALDGWDVTNDGDLLVYMPKDLQKGKVFMYVASGPFELEGAELKSWFSKKARRMQNRLGKPLKEWIVKPDKENWSISNSYIDKKSGVKLSVGYQGGMLDRNRAYIITMITSEDIVLLMKYGLAFNTVLTDAKKNLAGRSPVSGSGVAGDQRQDRPREASKKQAKSERQKIKEAIRTPPGKGADLSDIELVWVYSDIDLIWGGMDVDTYLLFEDSTVYKDCRIPPDELNVEASKRLQPEQWSVWRKSWGTYQIKNKDDWVDLKGGPAGKAPEGAELVGNYLNAGGSQYSGSWKKYLKFSEDGRFEMSSFSMNNNSMMGGGIQGGEQHTPLVTVMTSSDKHGTSGNTSVIGTNVGGGTSSRKRDGSKNTGTYEVNDYTITLMHDNGWKHTELFFFEDRGDAKSIVYGNDLYFFDDD
jgi:hypothetical protein